MISEDVLEAGISRGILSDQQAGDLRALAREIAATVIPESEDDEKLRFITGFSDIFVTLGLGLFLGALSYLASQTAGPAGMWAVVAIAAWLLAEFFTRRRRMALPSIVLLCTYAFAVFRTADRLLALTESEPQRAGFLDLFGVASHSSGLVTLAFAITVAMVGLHYLRFRVPITIAAGTAALVAALVGLVFTLFPEIPAIYLRIVIGGLGLVTFALAMRFDLSDPQRETRRTDIAFWLHMLAAPLIVHALIGGIAASGHSSIVSAVAILTLFILIGVAAVVIDRRAILVSGLFYAGFAFSTLIRNVGSEGSTIPLTLLVLGTFVLLLSAGWRPVRAAFLKLLPPQIARNLPHPLTSS
ncbi:hypothetical protein AB4072_12350 [Microvirga sp. 2MCAF38]|uniref:hypothetical protein n=1 Tax=Microvirga sp. 2MCAF38 TaxID=3232989 RepID=UPI003F9722F2